ncbi:MAG TPA: class I SAM-dependent methyltransferase [Anaerolineae bacterium]|nr:class I SAM-dependent methyltransferase [Anaerolineae bacterium]HQK15713.1 class I SAM-dependent methyltransferase [Anaerolineae bacterium]
MTMDERINRVAALANMSAYGSEATRKYIDGAPHVKHASLRALYGKLLVQVYDYAKEHTAVPSVLDLGAGEGSATLPLLELGTRVTAVDISSSQLNALQKKCERFSDRLEVRCEDIFDTLKDKNTRYDIIIAVSFLHHMPDYLGMITEAVNLLTPYGQFFSFQDPLRYDSVGKPTMIFSTLAYFSWRIFRGDLVGGTKRRLRRMRGIYLEDSIHDNAEYHVIRNGVDQDAIFRLFEDRGFDCNIVRYFSTQSRLFQPIGSASGMKNTFAVIAQRKMRAR